MYKITIEEMQEVKETKSGEYGILKYSYMSTDQMQNYSGDDASDYKLVGSNTGINQYEKKIYGYFEDKEVTKKEAIKVYEQVVEVLDIGDVIRTINGVQAAS